MRVVAAVRAVAYSARAHRAVRDEAPIRNGIHAPLRACRRTRSGHAAGADDRSCDGRTADDGRAGRPVASARNRDRGRCGAVARSEEHTSELQSLMRLSYAVFCLKKKNTK